MADESISASASADAIVRTQAMLESTIAEIFVEPGRVRVEFEIGLGDMAAFRNIAPDDFLARFEPEAPPLAERLPRFFAEELVMRAAGGAPPPGRLVLDDWDGSLDFRGVRYRKTDGWSAPRVIRIVLDGEAVDRTTADAFRAALVESVYTARSTGTDARGGSRLPYSFSYTLRTDRDLRPENDSSETGADAPSEVARETAAPGGDAS